MCVRTRKDGGEETEFCERENESHESLATALMTGMQDQGFQVCVDVCVTAMGLTCSPTLSAPHTASLTCP